MQESGTSRNRNAEQRIESAFVDTAGFATVWSVDRRSQSTVVASDTLGFGSVRWCRPIVDQCSTTIGRRSATRSAIELRPLGRSVQRPNSNLRAQQRSHLLYRSSCPHRNRRVSASVSKISLELFDVQRQHRFRSDHQHRLVWFCFSVCVCNHRTRAGDALAR